MWDSTTALDHGEKIWVFSLSQGKKYFKDSERTLRAVCTVYWSYLWATHISTSSFQPSRDEKKIFHKNPKFCNFPKQQQGPQTVLKRQTEPEENQAHPQNHKIKQLACSNSEFYHQYMWRRSNYVHKTQGIPEITWKKIFLLNPLHCYRLKPIIFQIHIEEWPLIRCSTTSWVRVFLSYCFLFYYLLVIFSFSCGLHDDDSKQCMGIKIKSEE